MYSILSVTSHEDGWARSESHLIEALEGVLVTIHEVTKDGARKSSDFIFADTGLEPWTSN
tara:strand:- start:1272 stop:1451 length:180 start_codon:yes stop_codon:yes gene_type:complete